jgi:DNA-directed RNA polymerase specialized sigma subunit
LFAVVRSDGPALIGVASFSCCLIRSSFDETEAANLPKIDYTIRSGLRLVDELVQEFAESRTTEPTSPDDDMRQEALSALLSAMRTYDERILTEKPNKRDSFEMYAQRKIRQHLKQYTRRRHDEQFRRGTPTARRIPASVQALLDNARQVTQQLVEEKKQQEPVSSEKRHPTLAEVAARLHVSTSTLRNALRLVSSSPPRRRQPLLSMESTIEITHPGLDDESAPTFRDQDEWEWLHGVGVLSESREGRAMSVDNTAGVENFRDDMIEQEGDDEAWVKQQALVAGPLVEVIPDTEELSPQDRIQQDMMRTDISHFLSSTLTPQQVAVVRATFGLNSGAVVFSTEDVAASLGILPEEVTAILETSLQLLRQSFDSTSLDDDDYYSDDGEVYGEDSA